MKTFRLLFIFTAALIFAVSCSEEESADMDMLSAKKTLTYDMDAWNAAMPSFCGSVKYHDLIGGQTILMGSVAVANDGTHLFVKYEADPGYMITETHLFIGDVMGEDFPKGKKDNVKIGHFPYASENYDGSSVVVYKIALNEIEGDYFDVAAHAVVMCEDGSCEETAWGAGRQSDKSVYAAKAFFKLPDDGGRLYGLTDGVFFAEDCSWGSDWGYVVLDMDNFSPGTDSLYSNGGRFLGTIKTYISNDSLFFEFTDEPLYELDEVYLYVGTLNNLLANYDDVNCPIYQLFPYQDFVNKIALSDLPTESSSEDDPLELSSTRWGFYFEYVVSECN